MQQVISSERDVYSQASKKTEELCTSEDTHQGGVQFMVFFCHEVKGYGILV